MSVLGLPLDSPPTVPAPDHYRTHIDNKIHSLLATYSLFAILESLVKNCALRTSELRANGNYPEGKKWDMATRSLAQLHSSLTLPRKPKSRIL